MATVVGRGEI